MLRVVVKQALTENIGKINTWCLGQADRKIRIVVRFFSAASRTRMCDETFSDFIFGT